MDECSVFAALVGKPNVGKSTLLNRFVGAKIAIISPKPQTTRNKIMGVLTEGECQFVFLDTPGLHLPRTRLGEHMMQSVKDATDEVDAALFLTWPKSDFDETEQKLLGDLFNRKIPVILVVNKADTAQSKKKLAEYLEQLSGKYRFADALAVSALDGDGCDALLAKIREYAQTGPHFFDDDTLTDQPERTIVSELLREKMLTNLRDELPHGCGISIERYSPRQNSDITDINAEILCERESHKGMIIGKGGRMLKKIASEARVEMEDFLGCRVNLQCRVKVREDWRNKEQVIKYLGY